MHLLRLFLPFILLLSMVISACEKVGEVPDKTSDGQVVTIYTTVYPLQFFSQQIGGEWVEAYSIYPPGADEHTFEPSQKDMMNLADADLFFYIGLGLEGFVEKTKKTLNNHHVTLIATGKNIAIEASANGQLQEENNSKQTDHVHSDIDPHVWIDPLYAIELAQSIKKALVDKFPEQRATFEENFLKLKQDLLKLDAEFTQALENAKRKEFIVSHAAYGYWEKRYGVKQINIAGISSSSEPSQRRLEQLISTAKSKQIKYVLVEQNVNPRLANIVKKEINAATLPLHNLAVLTNDDIENNEDYFSLMRKNIATIKKALH